MGDSRAAVRWAVCAGFYVLVVACTGATPAPNYWSPYDTGPTPTFRAPTPSPKPTRQPDPTWTVEAKGHACRATAALKTAEAEGTQAYTDAQAGRWQQVLAHAENVESQGQRAIDEFGWTVVPPGVPNGKLVSSLADVAQEYRDSADEVVWNIEHGIPDLYGAQHLTSIGIFPDMGICRYWDWRAA